MLFLLSPGGFTDKPTDKLLEEFKTKFGANKLFLSFARYIFFLFEKAEFNPFQLMNLFNRKSGLNGFLSGPRLAMTAQESNLLTEYSHLVTELNWCSDRALGKFLKFGRYSKNPLA